MAMIVQMHNVQVNMQYTITYMYVINIYIYIRQMDVRFVRIMYWFRRPIRLDSSLFKRIHTHSEQNVVCDENTNVSF
jgi:hypothetical protein